MISIPALLFLFLIQFILIFLGLAVFLFIRHRKLDIKVTIKEGEIRRLESEIEQHKGEIAVLSNWQNMFNDLQQKFEQVNSVNAKLKEMIDSLIPEAERSKEFQDILQQMESNNMALSTSMGTLKNENEALSQKMQAAEKEAGGLAKKLKNTVSKQEYDNLMSEKTGIELKVNRLKDELEAKTKEYEKLEKNFIYLEKEYNALYQNLHGEASQ